MRITVIPCDGAVNIDGVKFSGIDLSFFDPSYHAIQWYETFGEIEIQDPTTKKILENREITDITDIYNQVLPLWQAKKNEETNQLAGIQANVDSPVVIPSPTN